MFFRSGAMRALRRGGGLRARVGRRRLVCRHGRRVRLDGWLRRESLRALMFFRSGMFPWSLIGLSHRAVPRYGHVALGRVVVADDRVAGRRPLVRRREERKKKISSKHRAHKANLTSTALEP